MTEPQKRQYNWPPITTTTKHFCRYHYLLNNNMCCYCAKQSCLIRNETTEEVQHGRFSRRILKVNITMTSAVSGFRNSEMLYKHLLHFRTDQTLNDMPLKMKCSFFSCFRPAVVADEAAEEPEKIEIKPEKKRKKFWAKLFAFAKKKKGTKQEKAKADVKEQEENHAEVERETEGDIRAVEEEIKVSEPLVEDKARVEELQAEIEAVLEDFDEMLAAIKIIQAEIEGALADLSGVTDMNGAAGGSGGKAVEDQIKAEAEADDEGGDETD